MRGCKPTRGCGDSSRVDDGCCEIDHGGKALVGFAGAHGYAFELFEFAEEVFDEMAPFVHLGIDLELLGAAGMLRNDDLRYLPTSPWGLQAVTAVRYLPTPLPM